jgi:hypothetical protein
MTYRPKDIKKSDFVAQTSLQTTDYMDIVRNSQNFKVSLATLAAHFAAAGPLQTVGESTGTPILSVVSAVNYIRNFVDGPGIVSAVSPLGGLKVSHNFTVDKTGVAVVANEAAASPTIRSIQGGTGITVGGAGGVIQISTSGSPGTTKTIQVFAKTDLPAPSAGIITLADNTQYLFQNDVSLGTDRLLWGTNTVISGGSRELITLTYTGTGVMITATDKDVFIDNIQLSCASGTHFSVTDSVGDTQRMQLEKVFLIGGILGTITAMQSLTLIDGFAGGGMTDGFTFSGAWTKLYVQNFGGSITSGANDMFDLNAATFDTVNFVDCSFTINGTGYVINGLASSGNINAGGLGTITRCAQFGTATFLNNISAYDSRWEMLENSGIPNSDNLSLATHGGATITIAASSTPVIIGATWTSLVSRRFTGTAGGRFTYTGKGASVDITASITGQRAAAGTDTFGFYLYKNGVQIAASVVTRAFTNADGNLAMVWSMDLATSDYLELWVENSTGTADFVVSALNFRIS